MNHIKVTKERLSVEEIFDLARSNSYKNVYMFSSGKDSFEDCNITNSETLELKDTCNEVRSRWPSVGNIVMKFRTGPISDEELRVIIAVSSEETVEAVKATECIIDNLKKAISTWTMVNLQRKPISTKREIHQSVEAPYVPPYLIQLKITNSEIEERISKFMQRKRSEVDIHNIREFCCGDRNSEFTCARVDAIMQKKKGSKSHLQVHQVLNSYQNRDQKNSNYLTKFIPDNGVEERLANVENQLSLTKPVAKNIYQRLKLIEDRMLQLETVSPEYIQFWSKVSLPSKKSAKKRKHTINDIDSLIEELEMKAV